MIVLAKKIVMDEVAPIPEYYDPKLNNILMYNIFYQGVCSRNNPRKE